MLRVTLLSECATYYRVSPFDWALGDTLWLLFCVQKNTLRYQPLSCLQTDSYRVG